MPKDKKNNHKDVFRHFFTTQTWWGKILGAIMGYLIGGPAGALFGLLVGNLFDRGLAEHFSHPYWHYHTENREQIQQEFFKATFLVIGHIAKKDGRVTEEEIHMASAMMREMKLNKQQKKLARNYFREGKQSTFDLKQVLTHLRHSLDDNPELLKLFVEIQYRAASVDGLTQAKIEVMDTILLFLGFAPLHKQYRFYEDFDYSPFNEGGSNTSGNSQSRDRYSDYSGHYERVHKSNNPLDQAYAILEVSPKATQQEVKKAYRRLMSKNHPDKLISKGLPEEMIRLANDKTQKIAKAYEQICRAKGWS